MIFQIINRAPSGAARQISSLLRQPVEMIHRPKECCLEQPACWELGTIYIWNLQTFSGLIHVQLKYVKTIRYTYTSGKQQARFFLSLRVWPCVLSVTYRYDFFEIWPCPAAIPLLTGQYVFCNLGFAPLVPAVWVSRLEAVFWAVCWNMVFFFPTWCLENTLVVYGCLWAQIWWQMVANMAVFGARFLPAPFWIRDCRKKLHLWTKKT